MLVILVLALVGARSRGRVTSPRRTRSWRADGNFQVRDYPALTVVETAMTGSRNGGDGSFMRLFRFITGGNEAKQKIAMTTPVFMSGGETNATMAFVLPAKMRAGKVPKPSDGSVTVRELLAGRFAVLRYSGGGTRRRRRNRWPS